MKTHNLTVPGASVTSGRSVYKGKTFWYWQDDMCGSDGGDEGYATMQEAFNAALEHAKTCPHRNYNRR